MTTSAFEQLVERVSEGQRLTAADVTALASTPDILALGMLADTLRRRVHGTRVTYLRVAQCAFDRSFADAVPPAAREVRITGVPDSVAAAVSAVQQGRTIAAARAVSGFSWATVRSLAAAGGLTSADVLKELRHAGLDAITEVPIDGEDDLEETLGHLAGAGFQQVRLTLDKAPADERVALFLRAGGLREQFPAIRAINPLPTVLSAFRPTTGYEDVKMVAIARLAAPDIPDVQVDWQRYGPKLAQVALTFGANDLDAVTASDEAPDGKRRAPLEEVRRNIEAAGFTPAERDGRFTVLA
jgi:aminodeoxyfutalosine synthase